MPRLIFPRAARLGMTLAVVCCVGSACATRAAAFSKAIWGQATINGVNQFPRYRQLGVSIVETDLDWSQVAPTRPALPTNPNDPAYVWPASIHQLISDAAAYHMRVLLQIANAPEWADGGQIGTGWAPISASTYVAFAHAAAVEYPSVHLWMVWGEPTRAGSFMPLAPATVGQPLNSGQRAAEQLYAEMVDGTYGALKQLSKRNLIIGGCTYTTGLIDPLQWIQNLRLPDGRPPRMDMYAHNPFSYSSPLFTNGPSAFGEVQFANLPELAGWVDHYLRKGMPLFLSEWLIPTGVDQLFNFSVPPLLAAQWVTQALRESRAWHRIYALGWSIVYDSGAPCVAYPPPGATIPLTCGGLLSSTGVPKPDFYAFEKG